MRNIRLLSVLREIRRRLRQKLKREEQSSWLRMVVGEQGEEEARAEFVELACVCDEPRLCVQVPVDHGFDLLTPRSIQN